MLFLTPNEQCQTTENTNKCTGGRALSRTYVNLNVNVNVEFKVTLHEQVRCRGTLQY